MSLLLTKTDWFYHAPRTNVTEKPEKALPVSQIPGIGDLDHTPVDPHEDIHLRRKWIRETDSKYVKLAKEGGRKGKYFLCKPLILCATYLRFASALSFYAFMLKSLTALKAEIRNYQSIFKQFWFDFQ